MRNKLSLDQHPHYIQNRTPMNPHSGRRSHEYSYTETPHERNQDDSDVICMVDHYLSKRIDFVNESRSNEVKELTRIKNSLQEKLGEIRVNPEDIPYKRSNYPKGYEMAKPMVSSSVRRNHQQRTPNKQLNMVSFQTQINECDRLLNDLGVKCREYVNMESVKPVQPVRYKIKTELRPQPEPRERKLPLLKTRRSATQQVYVPQQEADHPFRKKYDHTDEALLVVPFSVNEHPEGKKSEAPTTRSPYIPTRSRRSSIDNKSLLNPIHKKREISMGRNDEIEDSETIEHKRKKSMTIDVDMAEDSMHRIRESGMSFHPLKVKNETPVTNKSVDKKINTNQSYLRSHQLGQSERKREMGTQNELSNSDEEKQREVAKEIARERRSKNTQRERESREFKGGMGEQKQKQTIKSGSVRERYSLKDQSQKQSRQLSHSKSKDSKHSQSPSKSGNDRKSLSHIPQQKSIIPQLSMAKMRGLKLYERIKQYKSKASTK